MAPKALDMRERHLMGLGRRVTEKPHSKPRHWPAPPSEIRRLEMLGERLRTQRGSCISADELRELDGILFALELSVEPGEPAFRALAAVLYRSCRGEEASNLIDGLLAVLRAQDPGAESPSDSR